MNDNDLISRSHFDDRVRLAAGPDADEEYSADFLDGVKVVLYMLSTEPAVPHEMTARELFSTRDRMCNGNYNGGHMTSACKTCPLWRDNNGHDMYCGTLQTMHPLAFIAIVEKWAREHPEERSEE